jgi:cell wall-associated NlpC family hydrolase
MAVTKHAMLDPRLTPARPDLAAAHLTGQVEAARFVEGRPARLIAASSALRRRPETGAPWETEALHGETAMVYEKRDGWAWVQLDRDGYVGYLESAALGSPASATHRVAALRTHAYPGPSIKLPHVLALPLGARLAIAGQTGDFLIDHEGRHFWARHLAAVESVEPDFVAVAERFEHCPYLWGGRTSEGIDCSGLTQAALTAAGLAAPRDSDMLEKLGEALSAGMELRRGDLVFWKGHVGLMRDAATLLHANGHHMAVASEPLADARARISASGGGEITSIRRL